MTNIKTIALDFQAAMLRKTRNNCETFVFVDDNAARWIFDAVHDAHHGQVPNDVVFNMIEKTVDALVNLDEDADEDDARERMDEQDSPEEKGLVAWLGSAAFAFQYCDDFLSREGRLRGSCKTYQLLKGGWLEQFAEVSCTIVDAIVLQVQSRNAVEAESADYIE